MADNELRRRRLKIILLLVDDLEDEKGRNRERITWTRSWIRRRDEIGVYHPLIRELTLEDEPAFAQYFRKDKNKFDDLVGRIAVHIERQPTIMRTPISPGERLALTLRYLATGETFSSLESQFCISRTAISEVIFEIIFHCDVPPAKGSGGLTPIARNSEAFEHLDPKVVQKFEEKKVRYIRKLPCEETGLPYTWESTFRTHNRKEVENYLEDGKFSYVWNEDDSLDFWCNLPAIIYHPLTKEKIWFNQAHTHHYTYWKNEPVYEKIIIDSDIHYPTNTAYGDGTEIEPEVIQHIRESIWKCTVGFEWKKSDTLILDNIQIMHGRLSFTGDRRILVSLSSD